MSARFSRADVTTPTVVAVPTETMSGSDVLMPSTLSSSGTPTTRSSRLTSTVIFIKISGRLAGGATTRPTRPSAFVSTGSRFVPIALSPPGRTSFRADLPIVLGRLLRVDDVDLVLHDHDLVDADDAEGHQVLLRLRLRAVLVRRDHEQGPVHDRRAAEHRGHERLVARRIDERHNPLKFPFHVVRLADLRVLIGRGLGVLRTLVDRHVGIAQADRDAPLDLLAVPIRPLSGETFREGRFPVVDVTHDADVDLRLARDLHRACSCHASSIDFGPRTTIFRFS